MPFVPPPGKGERVCVDIVPTGFDAVRYVFSTSRAFARYAGRKIVAQDYGGRMPQTPLFMIRLPNKTVWRLLDVTGNVEPFRES